MRAIRSKYRKNLEQDLDLDNPQKLSDKVQWLKLNYHDPLMTQAADKIAVREIAAEKVGEEHLVPIVGIYQDTDDIDWDSLPDKFVAKTNNGYGSNIVCTDKSKLDKQATLSKLNEWLKPTNSHYWKNYERQYKDIAPRIIVERYIGDKSNAIYEYKFFYIDSKLAFIQVPVERDPENQSDVKLGYYDRDWQEVPMRRRSHEAPKNDIGKPSNLEKMLEVSKVLAADFPVCRVDLYEHEGQIMLGELTLTPSNGLYKFEPNDWDERLGHMLDLPERNNFELVEWKPVEKSLQIRRKKNESR